MAKFGIGQAVRRVEDQRFLTGDGLGYIARVTLSYLVIMVLFTLVITVFPGIALWLPNVLTGR